MDVLYMLLGLTVVSVIGVSLLYVFFMVRYLTFNPNHMLRLCMIRGWSSRADKFVKTWCPEVMQAEFLGEWHPFSRELLQALQELEGMPYKSRYPSWIRMTPEDSAELHEEMRVFIDENNLYSYVSRSKD